MKSQADRDREAAETYKYSFFKYSNSFEIPKVGITEIDKHFLAGMLDERAKHMWTPGLPPKYISEEWFFAKLKDSSVVALKALPKPEFSYDFKTHDETFYKKELIEAWMQNPDTEFKTTIEEIENLQSQLAKQESAVQGLVDAANEMNCECTIQERLSGHRISCGIPQLQDALKAFEEIRKK